MDTHPSSFRTYFEWKTIVFSITCAFILLMFSRNASPEGGWTFYTYTNFPRDIAVCDDDIWCATEGGVVHWNRKTMTFEKHPMVTGRLSNRFTTVAIDRAGAVWFAGSQSVVSYRDGVWQGRWGNINAEENVIMPMASDMDNVMWFGSAGFTRGVMSIDGSRMRQYTTNDGLVSNNVWSVAVDSTNVKWFGTPDGVSRYDDAAWKTFTVDDGLVDNFVVSIAVDSDNVKWFKTNSGLVRYDGDTWTSYEAPRGIGKLAVDRHNTLWLAHSMGISVFNGSQWITSIEPGMENYLGYRFSLAIDNGNTAWFVYKDCYGLKRFDGASFETFFTDDPLASTSWIYDIAVDHDNILWLGHGEGIGGGVTCFDGTQWTQYTESDGLASNIVNAIAIGPDNVKWFGHETNNGGVVTSFDGTTWTRYSRENGVPLDRGGEMKRTWKLTVDYDNVLWVGYRNTGGRGIASFDGDTWTEYMPDLDIQACAVDHDNTKWFGTYGQGIYSFDGREWKKYTLPDRLNNNTIIYDICVDDTNVKWFGTSSGLARFDGTQMESFAVPATALAAMPDGTIWSVSEDDAVYSFDGHTVTTLGRQDGLQGNYFNTIVVDRNNTVWIGSKSGLLRHDEERPTWVSQKTNSLAPFIISGNFPNPFNAATTIEYHLNKDTFVDIMVYNALGQLAGVLSKEFQQAGTHTVLWNAANMPTGLYFYTIRSGVATTSRKMLLVK